MLDWLYGRSAGQPTIVSAVVKGFIVTLNLDISYKPLQCYNLIIFVLFASLNKERINGPTTTYPETATTFDAQNDDWAIRLAAEAKRLRNIRRWSRRHLLRVGAGSSTNVQMNTLPLSLSKLHSVQKISISKIYRIYTFHILGRLLPNYATLRWFHAITSHAHGSSN